jgi:hypothetical protein
MEKYRVKSFNQRGFELMRARPLKGIPSQFYEDEFGIGCAGAGSVDGIKEELIDAMSVSGAGGYGRPGSFVPAYANPTSRALRYTLVDHHVSKACSVRLFAGSTSGGIEKQKTI